MGDNKGDADDNFWRNDKSCRVNDWVSRFPWHRLQTVQPVDQIFHWLDCLSL